MKFRHLPIAACLLFGLILPQAHTTQAQAISWAKKIDFWDGQGGNSGGGSMHEITMDAAGNSYVCGMSWAPVDFGGGIISTTPGSNAFIAKYDAVGNPVWAQRLNNSNVGNFNDLLVTANGDLFFTARWTGTSNVFGLPTPALPFLDFGGIVGRMNTAGQMQSMTTFAGDDYCELLHLAEASNGDLFVSGAFSGTLQVGPQSITSVGAADMFVIRLTQAGTVVWLQQIEGNFEYFGQGYHEIAVDPNDNLILSTFLLGSAQVGANTYQSAGNSDLILAKFDPNGNILWSSHYGGTGGEYPGGMAVDGAGNIFWSGEFTGSFSIGSNTFTANGSVQDLWLAKMSPSGTPVWAVAGGGASQDRPFGLAINANAEVFVVGTHGQSATFGSITLNNLNTAANHMVLKYDSSGTILSAGHWGRPVAFGVNNGSPASIAVDASGHPRIAGILEGIYDFDGIHLTQTGLNMDGYVARMVDNANWITGTVYRDFNQSGTIDLAETGFPAAVVEALPGPRFFYSNPDGAYRIGTDIGNYSLSIPNPPLYHTVTSPTSHTAAFVSLGNVDSLNHFGLYPTPNINDLRISLAGYHPPRPGDTVYFQLHYTNVGTTTLSGTVKFLPDLALTLLGSTPVAANTVADTLFWNFSNLAPQADGHIVVSCRIPLIPTISLGDTLALQAWVTPLSGDAAPLDNYALLHEIVVGAYDPNDKAAVPNGALAIADVSAGMWLDYKIRFQNTGTDTAFQVVVLDTLDPNLEISSLEMLSASHAYHINLSGPGHLAWYFNNILLPDSNTNEAASHGFITYRIRPKNTLQVGQMIENTAAIYFDLNPPIITNTTSNWVTALVGTPPALAQGNFVQAYPNPSKGQLFLEASISKSGTLNAQLCDLQGRTLKAFSYPVITGKQILQADCSGLPTGIYLLRIETNGTKNVLKIAID